MGVIYPKFKVEPEPEPAPKPCPEANTFTHLIVRISLCGYDPNHNTEKKNLKNYIRKTASTSFEAGLPKPPILENFWIKYDQSEDNLRRFTVGVGTKKKAPANPTGRCAKSRAVDPDPGPGPA